MESGKAEKMYLLVAEAAEIARVGESTIYEWIDRGLPSIKPGRRRLIPAKEFHEWLRLMPSRKDEESSRSTLFRTDEEG